MDDDRKELTSICNHDLIAELRDKYYINSKLARKMVANSSIQEWFRKADPLFIAMLFHSEEKAPEIIEEWNTK